jgi:hypothetical protein
MIHGKKRAMPAFCSDYDAKDGLKPFFFAPDRSWQRKFSVKLLEDNFLEVG